MPALKGPKPALDFGKAGLEGLPRPGNTACKIPLVVRRKSPGTVGHSLSSPLSAAFFWYVYVLKHISCGNDEDSSLYCKKEEKCANVSFYHAHSLLIFFNFLDNVYYILVDFFYHASKLSPRLCSIYCRLDPMRNLSCAVKKRNLIVNSLHFRLHYRGSVTVRARICKDMYPAYQCCGTVTIYYGSGSGSGSDF